VNSKDTIRSLGHQEITFELELKVLTIEASGVRIQVRDTLSHGELALYLGAGADDGTTELLELESLAFRALEGSLKLELALNNLAALDEFLLAADSLVLQADSLLGELLAASSLLGNTDNALGLVLGAAAASVLILWLSAKLDADSASLNNGFLVGREFNASGDFSGLDALKLGLNASSYLFAFANCSSFSSEKCQNS
jgi:hypothetical protein